MEYTFTWFIENYSCCLHKNGDKLKSPEFFAEGLMSSAWRLCLYPRGIDIESKGCLSLYLERSKDDEGPDRIPLKFELWFLTADGSIFDKDYYEYTFRKAFGYGSPKKLQMHELFFHQKASLLTEDTLGVRCKMIMNEVDIRTVGQEGNARTCVGVNRISFIHEVETFSSLDVNQKNTLEIQSSTKNISVESSIYLADSCCDGKIFLEVTPCSDEITLLKCSIFLLDASGVVTKCGEEDNRFDDTRKDISKLPLSLSKKNILKRKSKLLPDDKLTLVCECIFSTGVEYKTIDGTLYRIPPLVVSKINDDRTSIEELMSPFPSALDELKELYSTQFLTDVKIKTETKSYPAHRNLLSARSPVFEAMFTIDMKEKYSESILVNDLENETVEALLHFLYSDDLENIKYDSAMQLYFAADKYVIQKLKLMCSSILLDGLSTSNAIELLLLAYMHSDSCLQEAVGDFILNHEEEVFSSDEWAKLVETHPALVSKTMMQKYVRRN